MAEEINFILPASVLEAILRYLIERPMKEVEAGVIALRNLKPLVREEQAGNHLDLDTEG